MKKSYRPVPTTLPKTLATVHAATKPQFEPFSLDHVGFHSIFSWKTSSIDCDIIFRGWPCGDCPHSVLIQRGDAIAKSHASRVRFKFRDRRVYQHWIADSIRHWTTSRILWFGREVSRRSDKEYTTDWQDVYSRSWCIRTYDLKKPIALRGVQYLTAQWRLFRTDRTETKI